MVQQLQWLRVQREQLDGDDDGAHEATAYFSLTGTDSGNDRS